MYKNWPEICKVENDLLRLLVATTKDEHVLAGLEKGFPELFSEEASDLKVPASALRHAAQEWSRQHYESEDYI